MRCAEIAQESELTNGVARARGNGARADLLRAVVRAESAREQTVAVGDVYERILRDARHRQRARRDFRPDVDVVLRVSDDGEFTRRTRGGMHLDNVLLVGGIEAKRIRRAQVVLDGERELAQIGNASDVGGFDFELIHLGAVGFAMLIDVFDRLFQPLALQIFHLRAREALVFGLIDVIFQFRFCHAHPLFSVLLKRLGSRGRTPFCSSRPSSAGCSKGAPLRIFRVRSRAFCTARPA